jgi:uncharacterized protein
LVFRRRNPRSTLGWVREMIYPKGGFRRATQYLIHRMRRLPDEPHRIARGVFAGAFVSFPPIFGIQMLSAGLLAWAIRGNILAAVLSTFLSNPLTTPFVAIASLELGHWMLGIDQPLDFVTLVAAFANAGTELWSNITAAFSHREAHWDSLAVFFRTIYLPLFVGSIIPSLLIAVVSYWVTFPLVRAYQRLRALKTKERTEKRHRLRQALADAKARLKARAEAGQGAGDDDAPGSP